MTQATPGINATSSDEILQNLDADEGGQYEFADADLPLEVMNRESNEQLVARLTTVKALVQGAAKTTDYEDLRGQYIAVNKALNEKGVIAPRFRPSLSAGSKFGAIRTRDLNLIHNDHQVLDLHWLSTACDFDSNRDRWLPWRWHGLFGQELDIGLAQTFAGTGGYSKVKATEILNLSSDEELQLRSIQSEATRSWWRHHVDSREQVRSAILSGRIKNPKLRGCENTWPDAWLATECAKRTGVSAPWWYEKITGNQLPASTISNIKRRVPKLVKLDTQVKSAKSEYEISSINVE